MNDPQVSIIIPTFRRPALLKRALKSALEQTYSNCKVQIYDNASGDETAEVVAEFAKNDPRVSYHCHAENIGMLGNYQYAFSKIDTPYFSFLSDDDILFPWYLETVLEGFKQYPEAAFSASSALIISNDAQVQAVPLSRWSREGVYNPPSGFLEMIEKYPIPTCILFSQKVLEDAKKIDTQNAILWDCDFLLRLSSHFSFFISKKPCGILVSHDESFAASANLNSWMNGYSRLIQRIEELSLISQETRITATVALTKRYLQIMGWLCSSCLLHPDSAALTNIEEHLKRMPKVPSKIRWMFIFAKMSCMLGGMQKIAIFMRRWKRKLSQFRKQNHVSSLQTQYGQYAVWLKQIENER